MRAVMGRPEPWGAFSQRCRQARKIDIYRLPQAKGFSTSDEVEKELDSERRLRRVILMVVGVTDALSALKSAGELVKTLMDLRDVSIVQSKAIELQREIFTAQQGALASQESQLALLKRVSDLERELMRFENWEAEKQRYQLETLPPGIHMYRLKQGMEHGEPPHKICANCYNKGVKSLLHISSQGSGLTEWKCHACGFKEDSGHYERPQVNRSRDDWGA
jgi:hypothetical protein